MSDTIRSATDEITQTAKRAGAAMQRDAGNGVHAAEEAIRKGVEKSKVKFAEAVDASAHQIETAHEYLRKEARERPVTVTAVAVGAGVLLGLLLAGGRRR